MTQTNPFTQPPVIDTNPNHPYQAIPQYTAEQRSAQAQIFDTLDQYGLGSLAQFAWNEYLNAIPTEQIFLDIRNTPEYQQRFPAMKYLADKGQAITEGTYIQYEKTVSEKMAAAGLPAGFYDQPDDFTNFIKNDVSPDEIQSRIDIAKQAVYNSAPEDLQALSDYYGVQGGTNHIGDATAYFLDPEKALPVIQNQFIAAQTAGAAQRSGFGINQTQAESLATQGVTQAQAQTGFGTLGKLAPLFAALPGSDQGLTKQQGLNAIFGQSGADQSALESEQARRKAAFQQGGGFTNTQKGYGGVG